MKVISHFRFSARAWLLCRALLGALVAHLAHALHSPCSIYLPAHFAPLIAGLALGWRAGRLVGLLVVVSDAIRGHLKPAQLLLLESNFPPMVSSLGCWSRDAGIGYLRSTAFWRPSL